MGKEKEFCFVLFLILGGVNFPKKMLEIFFE
jgi:hypothetical protein